MGEPFKKAFNKRAWKSLSSNECQEVRIKYWTFFQHAVCGPNELNLTLGFMLQNVDSVVWNPSSVWQKESGDIGTCRKEVGSLWKFPWGVWQSRPGLFEMEREDLGGNGFTLHYI